MILLMDEFALLKSVQEQGGVMAMPDKLSDQRLLADVLATLSLLRMSDDQLLITDQGRRAVMTGKRREGPRSSYFEVLE